MLRNWVHLFRGPKTYRKPAKTRKSTLWLRLESLEDRLAPAVLLVNALGEPQGSINGSTSGQVTLREAIYDSINKQTSVLNQTGTGNDTIEFDPSLAGQTIQLAANSNDGDTNPNDALDFKTSSFFVPSGETLTIIGNGVTISAAPGLRLFQVASGGTLTLDSVTLENGDAVGFNGGQVGGGGGAGMGGAVFNQGTLTILNSTLTGNTAQGGVGGAATGNGGDEGGGGAGLASKGGKGETVLGKGGTPNGGGTAGNPSENGGFGGGGEGSNDKTGGFGGFGGGGGGAQQNAGKGGNGGVGGGGGGGAAGAGGGVGAGGGDGNGNGGGGGGLGGAILNLGTAVITNSTFTNNDAAGGSSGGGNAGNGQGLGGAIFNVGGVSGVTATLTLTNDTLAGNTAGDASLPTGDGGGLYNYKNVSAAVATIINTIASSSLNGNLVPIHDIVNNGGTLSGSNNDIMSSTGTAALTATITGNPMLQTSLTSNGGPTQTLAFTATSSPAIGGGTATGAPLTDQRGGQRAPLGLDTAASGNPSIGAYEPTSSYLVTGTGDYGDGTLRDGLSWATSSSNILAPAGTVDLITFNVATVTLAAALPAINFAVNIAAPTGATATVTINAAATATNQYSVFNVIPGGLVTMTGLTITGGNNIDGAGIINTGTLVLDQDIITGNTSTNSTVKINTIVAGGGGILNEGTLTVNQSLINGNTAAVGGGGIQNLTPASGAATLTVTNTTITGNTATSTTSGAGGGIDNVGGSSTATLTNDTIYANTSGFNGGGINVTGAGAVTLLNNIVAKNTASKTGTGPDIDGAIKSLGTNLIFSSAGSTGTVASDIIGKDPLLAALAFNNGPGPNPVPALTKTMGLLLGSPAIDAGTTKGAPTVDQRNVTRPQGSAVDIGAFESQGFAVSILSGSPQSTLVSNAFANPLVVSVTSNDGASLNPAGGLVTFTAPTGAGAASAVLNNGTTTGSTVTAVIAANGQASITATANGNAGSYKVAAAAAGTSVNFALTNVAPGSVAFKVEPSNTVAGTVMAPSVTVLLLDATKTHNPIPNFNVVLTLTGGGSFSVGGIPATSVTATTDATGTATFSGLIIDSTGNALTLTATAGSGATAVTSVSNAFNVTASQLAISPLLAEASGSTFNVVVDAEDANTPPNIASNFTGPITLTLTNSQNVVVATFGPTAATSGSVSFPVSVAASGTYTLTASSGTLTQGTATLNVVPAVLTLSAPSNTVVSGVSFSINVAGSEGTAGNPPASTFDGPVTLFFFAPTGAPPVLPVTVNAVNGTANFTGLSFISTGVYSVVAGDGAGGITSTPNPFDITVTASQLIVSAPTPDPSGINFTVTTTAEDASNATDKTFNGQVTLSALAGMTIVSTNPATAVNGVATFTVSIAPAGTYALQALGDGLTGNSNSIQITAHTLVFTPALTAESSGSAFSVTVGADDITNAQDPNFNSAVTLKITGPGAFSQTTTLSPAAAGDTVTFPGLTLVKDGTYNVTASTTGGVLSATGTITVLPSQLVFDPATPTSVVAPVSTGFSVTVDAENSDSSLSNSFMDQVTLNILDSTSTIVYTAQVSAVGGQAVFNVPAGTAALYAAGGYTMQASTGAPTNLTTATAANLQVTADELIFTAVPASSVASGNSFAVTVEAVDGNGAVDASYAGSITVAITTGTGTAGDTLSGTIPVTAGGGMATFSDLSINKFGTYTLTATATSSNVAITGPASGNIVITASQLVVSGPASVVSGSSFQVTVTAEDVFGDTVPTFGDNVSLTIANQTPGGGTLTYVNPASSVQAATAGQAVYMVSLDAYGNYTLKGADLGAANLPTVNSNTITVTASNLVITTAAPASVLSGHAFGTVLTAYDSLLPTNQVAKNFNDNVTVTITNSLSQQVATAVGTDLNGQVTFSGLSLKPLDTYTLTFTDPSLPTLNLTEQVTITASTVSVNLSPTPVTSGQFFTAAMQAVDALGTVDGNVNGTVTLTIASGPSGAKLNGGAPISGTFSNGILSIPALYLDKAGTYTLKATTTTAGGQTITGTSNQITVTASAIAFETLPAVVSGTPFTIKVAAVDINGGVATNFTGQVTLALVTSPGVLASTLKGLPKVAPHAVNGVATFPGLVLNPSNVYFLQASTPGQTTIFSGPITVTASHISVAIPTTQPPVNSPFAVTFTALDTTGRTALTAPLTLTLTSAPLNGVVTIGFKGTNTYLTPNKSAVFSFTKGVAGLAMTINEAGTFTFHWSSGGLSGSFTITRFGRNL